MSSERKTSYKKTLIIDYVGGIVKFCPKDFISVLPGGWISFMCSDLRSTLVTSPIEAEMMLHVTATAS